MLTVGELLEPELADGFVVEFVVDDPEGQRLDAVLGGRDAVELLEEALLVEDRCRHVVGLAVAGVESGFRMV